MSDYGNNVIRRVAISTATVTTMAGSAGLEGSADGTGSAARFNAPAGLSLDGGNLFISDFMDRTIRKLVLSTAEVTTLAGAPPVNGSADGSGAAAGGSGAAGASAGRPVHRRFRERHHPARRRRQRRRHDAGGLAGDLGKLGRCRR